MPWTCKHCDGENELGFNVCHQCNAPRPGAEPPISEQRSHGTKRTRSVEQTVRVVRPVIAKLESANTLMFSCVPIVFALVFTCVFRNLLWGVLLGVASGILTSYLLSVVFEWMICVVCLLESQTDSAGKLAKGDAPKK